MNLPSRAASVVKCIFIGALFLVLAACSDPSTFNVNFATGFGTYQSSDELGVLQGYWYKVEGEVTGLQQPADGSLSLIAPNKQVLETDRVTFTPENTPLYAEGASASTGGGVASGQYTATLELLGRTYTETVTIDGSKYLDFVTGLTVQSATTAAVSIVWNSVPEAELYEAVLWRVGEGGSVFATTATTYTFEADVELVPNVEYWVSVRAYSADKRMLERSQEIRSSEVEGAHFTLSEAPSSR